MSSMHASEPEFIKYVISKNKPIFASTGMCDINEVKEMVKNLKRGDEVITSGGIIGTVDRVMEDDRIEVIIGEGTKVQIIRSTITSLLKKEEVKK